jgi:uncharacterized protein YbcI
MRNIAKNNKINVIFNNMTGRGALSLTSGGLKQEIIKVYNEINIKIFDAGVKRQKVDFVGNKILILSINQRVPVLKRLDSMDRASTRKLDLLLFDCFKEEIKKEFEQVFKFNIVAILKDYDVVTEYSGTIIILDRDVDSYLKDEL